MREKEPSLRLCDLSEELLTLVVEALGSTGDAGDLLHLSAANRRLHTVVHTAERAWERLYQASFARETSGRRIARRSSPAVVPPAALAAIRGAVPAAPAAVRKQPADLGGSSASGLQQQKQQQLPWRERFKQRFVEARREERLLRAARMQRHEGAVHLLQAERHRLRQALRGEQATLVHLRGELAALRQATQQAAQQARRAELAQTYWQPVCVSLLQVAAREADLDQRIAVAALEVRKLSASLAATEKRLCDAQRKLRQLRP